MGKYSRDSLLMQEAAAQCSGITEPAAPTKDSSSSAAPQLLCVRPAFGERFGHGSINCTWLAEVLERDTTHAQNSSPSSRALDLALVPIALPPSPRQPLLMDYLAFEYSSSNQISQADRPSSSENADSCPSSASNLLNTDLELSLVPSDSSDHGPSTAPASFQLVSDLLCPTQQVLPLWNRLGQPLVTAVPCSCRCLQTPASVVSPEVNAASATYFDVPTILTHPSLYDSPARECLRTTSRPSSPTPADWALTEKASVSQRMARLPPMDGITTTLCPPTPFSSPAPSPPFLQRLWSFSEVADSWTRYGKVRANLLAIERCQANAINHVIGSTSVSSWYRWCADFEEAIDHMVAICATNLTTLAIYIDLNCLVSSVFNSKLSHTEAIRSQLRQSPEWPHSLTIEHLQTPAIHLPSHQSSLHPLSSSWSCTRTPLLTPPTPTTFEFPGAPSLPPLTSSESTVWLTDALVGTAPSSAATPAMTQSLATPSELCVESSGSAWPFPPSPSDPPRETGIGLEDWSNRSTSISERTYGSVGSSATSQNAGPSDDVCAKLGAIEGNKTSPSLPAPARPPLARANRSKKTSSSRSTSSRACARLKQTKANATEIESINLSADARRALQNREKSKRYNQRVQEQRGALESFVTYLLNHHHRHQIQAREDQSQQRKPTSSEQSLRRVVAMLQDDSRTGEDGPISEEAQETRKHDKHARKNSNSAQYQQLAAAAAAQTSIVASNVRKRQSKQRLRMDELRRFYAVQCMAEHLLLVGAAEKVSSESDGARPVGPSQSRKRVDSQSKASKPWTDRVFGSDASLRLMLEVFMSNKALWYHLIEAEKRQLSELSRRFPDSKVIIQYDAKAMDGDEVVVVVDQGEQKHQHPICSLVELLESQ